MVKSSIYFPLTLMTFLGIIAVVFGNSFDTYSQLSSLDSTSIINGTASSVSSEYSYTFGITETEGAISMIIGIIVVAGVIGLNILGSGLSDESVEIISTIIVYGGIWAWISAYTIEMFLMFWEFGVILYFILTFVYSYGIINKITGD